MACVVYTQKGILPNVHSSLLLTVMRTQLSEPGSQCLQRVILKDFSSLLAFVHCPFFAYKRAQKALIFLQELPWLCGAFEIIIKRAVRWMDLKTQMKYEKQFCPLISSPVPLVPSKALSLWSVFRAAGKGCCHEQRCEAFPSQGLLTPTACRVCGCT